jgi:hypothetical protein
MTDEITLTLPHERPFYGVARLVLGGVAARADLTVDHLEELELALDGLLERRDAADEITLALRVSDEGLEARLGPFTGNQLRSDLETDLDENLSLRRVLDAVVDRYEIDDRGDAAWIQLRKRIERGGTRG